MKYLATLAFALLTSSLFAATPDADTLKQIVGAWQLEFTTPDGVDREPIILVGKQYDKLVAWYADKNQTQKFKKAELKSDSLVLTFNPRELPEATVTLTGRLTSEGKCEGTGSYKMQYGDSGSWEFKGKRLPKKHFDETQVWNIDFMAPDGELHEAEVHVMSKGEKLYGWYSSDDFELLADKLTVKGDQVSMALAVKTRDGEDVKVTFRGKVEGERRIRGEAEYDLGGQTGTFSFNGKRKS